MLGTEFFLISTESFIEFLFSLMEFYLEGDLTEFSLSYSSSLRSKCRSFSRDDCPFFLAVSLSC